MAAVAANPAPTLENKVKPAKPDENAFKSDLAAAEKEHSAVQEKLVCVTCVDRLRFCLCSHNWLSFYFLFFFSLHCLLVWSGDFVHSWLLIYLY